MPARNYQAAPRRGSWRLLNPRIMDVICDDALEPY